MKYLNLTNTFILILVLIASNLEWIAFSYGLTDLAVFIAILALITTLLIYKSRVTRQRGYFLFTSSLLLFTAYTVIMLLLQ